MTFPNLTQVESQQLHQLLQKMNGSSNHVAPPSVDQSKPSVLAITTLLSNLGIQQETQNPIRKLRMEGKWNSLSREERQSIKQQFQETRRRIQESKKSTFKNCHNRHSQKEIQNPIRKLRMEGRWSSLPKEERQLIVKQAQEMRRQKQRQEKSSAKSCDSSDIPCMKKIRSEDRSKERLKNPMKELKAQGKWNVLSKEERQSIKKQFQEIKVQKNELRKQNKQLEEFKQFEESKQLSQNEPNRSQEIELLSYKTKQNEPNVQNNA